MFAAGLGVSLLLVKGIYANAGGKADVATLAQEFNVPEPKVKSILAFNPVGRADPIVEDLLSHSSAQLGLENVAAPLHAATPITEPASRRLKMLPPSKFAGDREHDVNDAIFHFETYLLQSGFPRESWAIYGMSLLEKQALSTYISYAQPLNRSVTWDEFKACLCTAFARPDRELSARKTLFAGEVKQNSSVADYLRRFRQIVARCGTSPDSQSLRDLFWQNLKPNVRDKCRIDPLTGKYWATFEALADHTVLFDSQTFESSAPAPSRFRSSKPVALNAVSSPATRGRSTQPHRNSRGGSGSQGAGGSGKAGHGKRSASKDAERSSPKQCRGLEGGQCEATHHVDKDGRDFYKMHNPKCKYHPNNKQQ